MRHASCRTPSPLTARGVAGGTVPAPALGTHDAPCLSYVAADCRPACHLPPTPPFVSRFLQSLRVARVRPAGGWRKVLRSRDHAEVAGGECPTHAGVHKLDTCMQSPLGLSRVPVSIMADAASSRWEHQGRWWVTGQAPVLSLKWGQGLTE